MVFKRCFEVRVAGDIGIGESSSPHFCNAASSVGTTVSLKYPPDPTSCDVNVAAHLPKK